MNRKAMSLSILTIVSMSGIWSTGSAAEQVQYFPVFVFRTGPFAPSGIPAANAARDFALLIEERDGGINGVKAPADRPALAVGYRCAGSRAGWCR